jgi:hypothetical protein
MAWEKKVAQREAVKSFVVLADGRIDLDASTAKYRNACLTYKAQVETEETLVAECMADLYDTHRGVTLNLDYIRSQTITRMTKREPGLNVPSLFSLLGGRVEDYLRANCDHEAVPAKGDKPEVAAKTDGLFARALGKNGGFYRKADASPKA